MKFSFLTIAILFSFLALKAQNQSLFVKDALSKWKGMKEYTLAVAEAMPEEKYTYRPVKEEDSFGF
jgi:hypothetical protein